jgi:hypothetical protein
MSHSAAVYGILVPPVRPNARTKLPRVQPRLFLQRSKQLQGSAGSRRRAPQARGVTMQAKRASRFAKAKKAFLVFHLSFYPIFAP